MADMAVLKDITLASGENDSVGRTRAMLLGLGDVGCSIIGAAGDLITAGGDTTFGCSKSKAKSRGAVSGSKLLTLAAEVERRDVRLDSISRSTSCAFAGWGDRTLRQLPCGTGGTIRMGPAVGAARTVPLPEPDSCKVADEPVTEDHLPGWEED